MPWRTALRWTPEILAGALLVLLALANLKPFPWGWDSEAYVNGLRLDMLPHSPYYLHFLLGKLFAFGFDPALALAWLSTASALAAVALYGLVLRGMHGSLDAWRLHALAFGAAVFLAFNVSFLENAGMQEVYAPQLALLMASALCLLRGRPLLAGVFLGLAFGMHNGTVFVLPAYAFLAWRGARTEPLRQACRMLAAAAVTVAALYLAVLPFLEIPAGADRWAVWLRQVRGMSCDLAEAMDPDWTPLVRFRKLLAHLYYTQGGLLLPAVVAFPAAALLGLIRREADPETGGVLRRLRLGAGWTPLLFWLLCWLPYSAYMSVYEELDRDIFIVYLFPALGYLAALSVLALLDALGRLLRLPPARAAFLAAVLAMVVFAAYRGPFALDKAIRWERDFAQAVAAHYTPQTLAAIWADANLPPDAVLLSPAMPRHMHHFICYITRPGHVARLGGHLFSPRTPPPGRLQASGFHPVREADLRAVLAAGRPVYAFAPDALAGLLEVDAGHFTLVREGDAIPFREVIAGLPVAEKYKRGLGGEEVFLYRLAVREQGRGR